MTAESDQPDDLTSNMPNHGADDFSTAVEDLQKALRLGNGTVTKEQIDALKKRYHFLQMYGPGGTALSEIEYMRVESSAITVINYGDAMTTSAGAAIYDTQPPTDITDHYLGGTIVARMWNTAKAMVQRAKEMSWESIHVVDGSDLMKAAVLVHGVDAQLVVTGADDVPDAQLHAYEHVNSAGDSASPASDV